MLPLFGLSVFSLAIILDKFLSLKSSVYFPRFIARFIHENAQDADSLRKYLKQTRPCFLLTQLRLVLDYKSEEKKLEELMQVEISKISEQMGKYLSALGTIAIIAPILGLLGTLVGMLQVFEEVVVSSNLLALSDGIAKAMVTTIFGVSIAIPSTIFSRHFFSRQEKLIEECERNYLYLKNYLLEEAPPRRARNSFQSAYRN